MDSRHPDGDESRGTGELDVIIESCEHSLDVAPVLRFDPVRGELEGIIACHHGRFARPTYRRSAAMSRGRNDRGHDRQQRPVRRALEHVDLLEDQDAAAVSWLDSAAGGVATTRDGEHSPAGMRLG